MDNNKRCNFRTRSTIISLILILEINYCPHLVTSIRIQQVTKLSALCNNVHCIPLTFRSQVFTYKRPRQLRHKHGLHDSRHASRDTGYGDKSIVGGAVAKRVSKVGEDVFGPGQC